MEGACPQIVQIVSRAGMVAKTGDDNCRSDLTVCIKAYFCMIALCLRINQSHFDLTRGSSHKNRLTDMFPDGVYCIHLQSPFEVMVPLVSMKELFQQIVNEA